MKTRLSIWFVVLFVFFTEISGSFAQSSLRDVTRTPTADEALIFHYPSAYTKTTEGMRERAPTDLAKLRSSLGVEKFPPIQVWVLKGVDDYFRLHQIPNTAPEWAAGLSFSNKATIVVSNTPSPGKGVEDIDATFRHELAHVAVDLAAQGKAVPRWFHEGFAVMHASEWTADRSEMLSRSAAAGVLIPIGDLEHRFPEHHNSASLAYAQSFHFVRELSITHGQEVYALLFAHMRDGHTFHQAFRKVTGESVPVAEARWAQGLKNASSFWSLFMDGMFIFFGASLLFLVAWRVRRKRTALKLASMRDNPAWDYDESQYPLPGER